MAGWSLVGRDEELGLLAGVVRERRGSAVVAGEVGVGKSRLVEDFLRRLRGEGTRVVLVRATRSTSTIPFGVFAPWAPERTGSATVADRLEVLRAISRELLAGEEPLVLGVDDAHLLDEGSAALLLHLVSNTSASVVVTVRTGERCLDAVVALWKEGLAERVDLQPLSEPETTDLLEAVVGGPADAAVQRRLWASTKGVPLYVREVVRTAIDQQVLAPDDGVWRWRGALRGGGRLGELVNHQLVQAGPKERLVLELVAFGEPLPVELVGELGSSAALADAEQHGYVVTEDSPDGLMVRLGHPLYGEVLRGGVPRLTARDHQQRLANAALAMGWHEREPLRVALWLMDSDAVQRPSGVLRTAANRALALAEWGLAERLARAAEDAGAGPEATLARAAALIPLQRRDEAEALLSDLPNRELDDETSAEVAVTHARFLAWSRGRPEAGLEIAAAAARRLPPPVRARVLAYGAYLAAFACKPVEAVQLSTEATAEAGAVVGLRVEALAVASLAWTLQGRTSAAATAAEMCIPFALAARGSDPNPTVGPVLPAAYALARILDGRLDEAAGIAEAALAMAVDDEVAIVRGLANSLSAWVALCQGRLDVARSHASEGLSILEGAHLVAHWPAAILSSAAAQQGDTASARKALDAVTTANELPIPLWSLQLTLGRAWLAAANGELSRAQTLAQEVAERSAAAGVWAFEQFALLDLARLGAPQAAAGRLAELAEVVEGAFAPIVASYAQALAAADGDRLDDTSQRFEAVGAVLLAAEGAAAAAAAHRQAGRRGSQLTSLARARALAVRCGGARTPALRDVDAEPVLGTLTDREREVVELAARDLTNRDIAARLFVSIRTVNTHLYRAYAKLGISDRAQLPALLAGLRDQVPPESR